MVRRPRLIRLFGLALLAGGAGFVLVSIFFAWRFTTPARRAFSAKPEDFLREFEAVRFPARDGVSLSGWFVPHAGSKRAVVLLHGNGSTRTQALARARFFRDHGYAVLLYDARGHGTSDGNLVSFGWFETRDLLGALDELRTRGFSEFGCLGISQGGATIALAAAELRDVRWVILESVYPTLANAIDRRFRKAFGIPGWLAGSVMVPAAEWRLGVRVATIAPRDAIAKLTCPLLILIGSEDRHTLPTDARELFDRARSPKQWKVLPGAAHVDLYGHAKGDYEAILLAFLATTS